MKYKTTMFGLWIVGDKTKAIMPYACFIYEHERDEFISNHPELKFVIGPMAVEYGMKIGE
jgi:hypothetical protein